MDRIQECENRSFASLGIPDRNTQSFSTLINQDFDTRPESEDAANGGTKNTRVDETVDVLRARLLLVDQNVETPLTLNHTTLMLSSSAFYPLDEEIGQMKGLLLIS